MSTSTPTLIAAGVTAAYLRDLTRRPAPRTELAARRATTRRRPDGMRADDPGPRRRPAPSHGSCRSRERISRSSPSAIGTTDVAARSARASVSGLAR
jgi:hypothetical protein